MKFPFAFVIALFLAHGGSLRAVPTATSHVKTEGSRALIHFEVINMSGQAREAHLGNKVVILPLAQRVALRAPAGGSVLITSNTNRRVEEVIVVTAGDEGRLLPVV